MNDLYQKVTDRIVAALEAGTPPWIRAWTRTSVSSGLNIDRVTRPLRAHRRDALRPPLRTTWGTRPRSRCRLRLGDVGSRKWRGTRRGRDGGIAVGGTTLNALADELSDRISSDTSGLRDPNASYIGAPCAHKLHTDSNLCDRENARFRAFSPMRNEWWPRAD